MLHNFKIVGKLNSAENLLATMPEEEELLQESEVHHNDFDVDEDDQMEESYDDPPKKRKCRNKTGVGSKLMKF